MDDEGGHRPDNTVVQQHLKMHANATHIPNGGSDVPDERLSGAIQALLARMILVEQEIDLFETFITVKGAFDHPLLHWPVYTGYENLGDVIENLDTAANNLRALIQQALFTKCNIKTEIAQARSISLKVSNSTAYMMKTMNEKTARFISETEDKPSDPWDRDAMWATMVDDLSDLITHSVAATSSVWAAMDLLETIPSIDSIGMPNKSKEAKYGSWPWMKMTVFVLSCFALVVLLCYGNPCSHITPQTPSMNSNMVDIESVFVDVKNIYNLLNESFHLTTQAQNAWLAELNLRHQMALSDTNERIDNVWDALGPPNAQGTYTGTGLQYATLDGRLREIQETLQRQRKKTEVEMLELKKESQRAQVRLTSRVSKLERRQR